MKCEKCGTTMQEYKQERRTLIVEVIERYYRCPECDYKIVVPEMI